MHEHLRPAFADEPSAAGLERCAGGVQILHREGHRVDALAALLQRLAHRGLRLERRHHLDEAAIRQVEERLLDAEGRALGGAIQFQAQGVAVGLDSLVKVADADDQVVECRQCHGISSVGLVSPPKRTHRLRPGNDMVTAALGNRWKRPMSERSHP